MQLSPVTPESCIPSISLKALSLICFGDSSPETYKVLRSLLIMGICSESVDLPMPGSPPSRIREPGTMPPPSILSISLLQMEILLSPLREISLSFTAEDSPFPKNDFSRERELFLLVFGSSTIVFHSPHAGHLPIHFALSVPQLEQNQTLVAFAIMQLIEMSDQT